MEPFELSLDRKDRITQPQRQFDNNYQQVIALPERRCIWQDFAERGESYDMKCYGCDGLDSRCGNYSR